LNGLNPPAGPHFVSAYLDDVLVFSQTLEEKYLDHLCLVLSRLPEAGLKLKPTKCHYNYPTTSRASRSLYNSTRCLRWHKIWCAWKNLDWEKAVREFPTLCSLKDVCAFVDLTSYHHRFIKGFAQIAHPLHSLTCKGVVLTEHNDFKQHSTNSNNDLLLLLAYPTAGKTFLLETDASKGGLGAVLSQTQSDGKDHPVAFASCVLSPQETHIMPSWSWRLWL